MTGDAAEPTDLELLRAWRQGDKRAGERLIRRHHQSVHRFFSNKVTEPRDLVQKTFLACVENVDRFRGDASFRTFLFSIAHNVLRKHFRAQAGPRGKVEFGTVSVIDLQQSPSEVLADTTDKRLLLRALRHLSVEQQELLELHYWEQLKTAEIARVLEIPEGTVKTRMRAARKLLEALIERLASEPGLVQSTLKSLDELGPDDDDDPDPDDSGH